jgi:hypothetical protein
MGFVRTSSIGLSLVMIASALSAQATPFLFSVTPSAGPPAAGQSKSAAYGYYELGYGERTFQPVAGDRLEQALGVRATVGSSVILLARTGVSTVGGDTRVSPQCRGGGSGSGGLLGPGGEGRWRPTHGWAYDRHRAAGGPLAAHGGGGPILRATRSDFASAADRPLPARNGYVLRSAVGFSW